MAVTSTAPPFDFSFTNVSSFITNLSHQCLQSQDLFAKFDIQMTNYSEASLFYFMYFNWTILDILAAYLDPSPTIDSLDPQLRA